MEGIRQRIEKTIREYDAQGHHRTGTRVDDDSALWLVGRVLETGRIANLESFSFDRVIPGESYVEINGTRIAGFPIFDGTFTDERGVHGRLIHLNSDARVFPDDSRPNIAVIEFPPAGKSELLDRVRLSNRFVAVVGVVHSNPPGLAIRNAEQFMEPVAPPVLQVSSAEYEKLGTTAKTGSSARVVVKATTESSSAKNVIVEIGGRNSRLSPLVVMTPRSGWFNCAIERGGGISCWLEILAAFSNHKPNRRVLLIATSGHELGHLGLKSFIGANPELPRRALAWLHLGASIGAAINWQPGLQTSDADLEKSAFEFLTDSIFEGLNVVPAGQVKGGEAQEIHGLGGRYVSIVGRHDHFHLESDRWPDAVDLNSLVVYSRAITALAIRLSN
ncbi:MAG: hypothetical protein O3B95_12135 [Chloroflexi bacterium]|nr:hypothetical protein [Chloroflexota bacterium]